MFSIKKKNRIYWSLQLGGWSLYAFLHIFLVLVDNRFSVINILSILLTAAYFLLSTHIYRQIVIRVGWLNYRMVKLIPRILLSTFLLGMTWYIFEIGLSYLINNTIIDQDLDPYSILTLVSAAMAFYLLWAAIYFLYHYVDKTNQSLKYEAAFYEIELNQLKSQLNPHFIFNALNSIRALIDEDPIKSKTAVTQLSNILRNSLVINRRELVKLKDELRTVRDYLALESIRFEERLKINIEIDPKAESCQVPPLMIQTLVENGIKHGISKLTSGGNISVKAFIDSKDQLQIEIRNSGQVILDPVQPSSGYGIENTRRRLNLLFGDKASFGIENENNETVITKITIPQSINYESIDY